MPALHASPSRQRARRPFYKLKRLWLPPLFLLALVALYAGRLANTAYENYITAPPNGTRYSIVDDTVDGFSLIPSSNGKPFWTRICAMARGGTLTQEKLLLRRENVSLWESQFDMYETAVFRYTAPKQAPGGTGRTTASLKLIPWCPDAFRHSVPINTYDHPIK